MALTEYQRGILALLASRRIAKQESYLAGGAALIAATDSRRLPGTSTCSTTRRKLCWPPGRRTAGSFLRAATEWRRGYSSPRSSRPLSARTTDAVVVQWAVDSAFRFFPLVRGPADLPALHPFDLATNKTLALIGRLEPRDWVDLISCHDRIQHLGLLSWAACGKDPGTNPSMILNEAGRSGRYTQAELDGLSFDGSRTGRCRAFGAVEGHACRGARLSLPRSLPAEVGTCVLDASGGLYHGNPGNLADALVRER